jgi:hypothetical protein
MSNIQSSKINDYSYSLSFTTIRSIKNKFRRKVGWGDPKEVYPEKLKEDVSLNTEKATPFTAISRVNEYSCL